MYYNLGEVYKDLGEVYRSLDKLDEVKNCYDCVLYIFWKEFGIKYCLFKMIWKSLVEIE